MMKRFSKLLLCGFVFAGVMAFAQQPGPESTNNNRNEPSVNIQSQTPSGQQPGQALPAQPKSDTAPATETTDADKASADKAQGPASTDKTDNTQQGTSNQADQKVAPKEQEAPKQPQTVLLPGAEAPASADPLLEVPALPNRNATLVGGIATKVDRIRNRMELKPFGDGKKMRINFDERSHIYRDGRETTVTALKDGDRVYADTMLVDGKVFARNIRVQTQGGPAEARGQIMGYDVRTGAVSMLDQLTQQQVRFTVSDRTAIKTRDGAATTKDLKTGSLVDVIFQPGRGKTGDAREVSLLASPGEKYVFVGKVTYLDLSGGTMSVDNETDNKNYDLRFDPSKVDGREQLGIGSQVTASATFDGKGYRAQSVAVTHSASAQQ